VEVCEIGGVCGTTEAMIAATPTNRQLMLYNRLVIPSKVPLPVGDLDFYV